MEQTLQVITYDIEEAVIAKWKKDFLPLKEAERERKEKEEAARREALKPDREKLLLWVEWFESEKGNIPRPKLNSEDAEVILADALLAIQSVMTDIRKRVEEL